MLNGCLALDVKGCILMCISAPTTNSSSHKIMANSLGCEGRPASVLCEHNGVGVNHQRDRDFPHKQAL